MGLRSRLDRAAARGAHVLIVVVPGRAAVRAAVERSVADRGWRIADGPADADVLVVCGNPGRVLTGAIDRVWRQLPGPAARVAVVTPDGAPSALDRAAAGLVGTGRTPLGAVPDGEPEPLGTDAGDEERDGPAGIPLAGGSELDRDGLEMDVLQVPLGPVLRYWPAGLVLDCVLQGDVVMDAHVRVLDVDAAGRGGGAGPAQQEWPSAAGDCDSVAGFLALAGWSSAAAQALRLRNRILDDPDDPGAAAAADRLARRIGRSRLLRWSVGGLGVLHGRHVPRALHGDALTRVVARLGNVRSGRDGEQGEPETGLNRARLSAIPEAVTGLDLAAARLVVASLDPGDGAGRRLAATAGSPTR